MTKITSMFDFWQRFAKDKRYEKLLVVTYTGSYTDLRRSESQFKQLIKESVDWANKWIEDNSKRCTCEPMVIGLNHHIDDINARFPVSEPKEVNNG